MKTIIKLCSPWIKHGIHDPFGTFTLVLPWRGLKAASRTSWAVLKLSQAAVTALAYNGSALAYNGFKWLLAAEAMASFLIWLRYICLSPVGGDDKLKYIDFCMVLAHVTGRTNMWQNVSAKPFILVQYGEISLYGSGDYYIRKFLHIEHMWNCFVDKLWALHICSCFRCVLLTCIIMEIVAVWYFIVIHVDWLIFPFLVASHSCSHGQTKLSHSQAANMATQQL